MHKSPVSRIGGNVFDDGRARIKTSMIWAKGKILTKSYMDVLIS